VAVPARKTVAPATERIERGATPLPGWLLDQGFTPLPRGFFRELGRCLEYGALLCLGIVFEETLGRPRPAGSPAPEMSEPIREEQFARWTGLTTRAVREALARLDEVGVIARVKRGRAYCYKVVPERLFHLPERPTRKLQRLPKPAPALAQPVPIILSCPLGSDCPVSEVYDGAEGLTNLRDGEQTAKDTGTPVPVSARDTGTPVPVSARDTGTPVPVSARDTGTPVPVSKGEEKAKPGENGQLAALRAMLEFALAGQLHSVPDDAMVTRIARALGDAPLADLAEAIKQRRAKIRSWGLVHLIAQDCGRAWAKVGYRVSLPDLERQFREASGGMVLELARQLVAHPDLADWKREQILAVYPQLNPQRCHGAAAGA